MQVKGFELEKDPEQIEASEHNILDANQLEFRLVPLKMTEPVEH